MGFSSWTCSCCGKSIANKYAKVNAKFSSAIVVLPNRIIKESNYDGYGVFGGEDIFELIGNGDRDLGIDLYFSTQDELEELNITAKKMFDIKIVHTHCYNESMTYRYIKPSIQCPHQGFFFDEDNEDLI